MKVAVFSFVLKFSVVQLHVIYLLKVWFKVEHVLNDYAALSVNYLIHYYLRNLGNNLIPKVYQHV